MLLLIVSSPIEELYNPLKAWTNAISISLERQDVHEETPQPRHGHPLSHLTGRLVFNPRIRHLGGGDGVRGIDETRIHHPGQTDKLLLVAHRELLFAGHQQVAVWQDINNG